MSLAVEVPLFQDSVCFLRTAADSDASVSALAVCARVAGASLCGEARLALRPSRVTVVRALMAADNDGRPLEVSPPPPLAPPFANRLQRTMRLMGGLRAADWQATKVDWEDDIRVWDIMEKPSDLYKVIPRAPTTGMLQAINRSLAPAEVAAVKTANDKEFGSQWGGSPMIGAYMNALVNRYPDRAVSVDTFVFSHMETVDPAQMKNALECLIKGTCGMNSKGEAMIGMNVSPFTVSPAARFALYPCNEGGNHWVLYLVDYHNKSVERYDSLHYAETSLPRLLQDVQNLCCIILGQVAVGFWKAARVSVEAAGAFVTAHSSHNAVGDWLLNTMEGVLNRRDLASLTEQEYKNASKVFHTRIMHMDRREAEALVRYALGYHFVTNPDAPREAIPGYARQAGSIDCAFYACMFADYAVRGDGPMMGLELGQTMPGTRQSAIRFRRRVIRTWVAHVAATGGRALR